jgi:hypothetical protein
MPARRHGVDAYMAASTGRSACDRILHAVQCRDVKAVLQGMQRAPERGETSTQSRIVHGEAAVRELTEY